MSLISAGCAFIVPDSAAYDDTMAFVSGDPTSNGIKWQVQGDGSGGVSSVRLYSEVNADYIAEFNATGDVDILGHVKVHGTRANTIIQVVYQNVTGETSRTSATEGNMSDMQYFSCTYDYDADGVARSEMTTHADMYTWAQAGATYNDAGGYLRLAAYTEGAYTAAGTGGSEFRVFRSANAGGSSDHRKYGGTSPSLILDNSYRYSSTDNRWGMRFRGYESYSGTFYTSSGSYLHIERNIAD